MNAMHPPKQTSQQAMPTQVSVSTIIEFISDVLRRSCQRLSRDSRGERGNISAGKAVSFRSF
jgi:hypothetical protein